MSGGVHKTLAGSKRKGSPGEDPGVCAKILQVWSDVEDTRQKNMAFQAEIEEYERQNDGLEFPNLMHHPAYDVYNSLSEAKKTLKELLQTLENLGNEMTAQDVTFLVGAFGEMLEKHEQEREKIEEDAQDGHNKLTLCNAHIMELKTFREKLIKRETVSILYKFGFVDSVNRMHMEEAKKAQDPFQGAKLVYIGALPDVPKEIPLRNDMNVIGRLPEGINTPAMNSQNQQRMVSGSHANIDKEDGKWILKDLNSTNGTQVRIDGIDVRVKTHELQDKDIITFGGARDVAFGESPPGNKPASAYVYTFEAAEI